jgi:hypothetical protein
MKKLFIILFVLITTNIFSQGVAINNDGSNPNPSAILDIKSTDKGVLVPRMTQSQKNAITSPATGLLIYQSDGASGFYYYDGSAWVIMNSGNTVSAGSSNYIQNGTSAQTSSNYNISGDGTLGGDINVNGSDINGPGISGGSSGILRINSNTDVRVVLDADNNGSQQFDIAPNGGSTPVFTVTEAGNVTANGYVRMLEAGTTPTYYTSLQSGDLTGANLSLTLPTSAGTSGEYLKTDGAGVTSWSTLTQAGVTVNQTATIIPTTTTMATITGLTTTFTADANHLYFISTAGCIVDASSTINRNVNSQISIYVDGATINGGTSVATAQNFATTARWGYGPWSINLVVSLSAGSHTIDVRGNRRTESNTDNPTIGGAAGGICQGSLTVLTLTK